MATTAAVLEIAVRANTGTATSELRKMDRTLGSTAKSSRTAVTSTDRLNKSSRTLGGTMRGAVKYAVGLGAAYVGLRAAEDAVTATTDLAKSTLTLKKGFGLTAKTGSALGAVLQARGADATSTGMAFNTLSRQVEAAKAGSTTATKAFKDLGISQKDLKKSSPDQLLFKVSDGMQKLGAGTKRTADTSVLFGRGWKTMGPILRDGSQGLKDQLKAADDLGASFDKLGLKNMKDVIAKEREMKLAQLGLQISFTEAIAPAIDAVTGKLADWAKIMQDPKLTNTQKFNKIADDLTQLVAKGITAAAEEAGKRGPVVAAAFVKGFLKAPILGKLFLGTILLAKVGALKTVGAAFGKALIQGIATTKIGQQILSFFPSAGTVGQKGRETGAAYGTGVGTGLTIGIASAAVAVAAGVNDLLGNAIAKASPASSIFAKGKIQENMSLTLQAIKDFIPKFGELGASAAKNFRNLLNGGLFKNLASDLRSKLFGPFQDAIGSIVGKFGDLRSVFNSLPSWVKNGVKGVGGFLTAPFSAAVKEITALINDIISVINTVLGPVGVHIGSVGGGGGGSPSSAGSANQGRPGVAKTHKRKQRGGMMVPGQGSGDKVPALLEPGEFVLNRNAVAALGQSSLTKFNKDVPRFKGGGQVFSNPGTSGHPTTATSAAGGFNLPGVGSLPGWLKPAGSFVLDKVGGFIKKKLASVTSGLFSGGGPEGVGSYKGVPMANWVIQSLQYAGAHGSGSPQPTSGYRSPTQVIRGPVVAPQGHSEHQGTAYPHGAVDFGGPYDAAAFLKKMAVVNATRGFKWPLLAPIGFHDDGHASGTGHQKGGVIPPYVGKAKSNYSRLWGRIKGGVGGKTKPELVPTKAGKGFSYVLFNGPTPLNEVFGSPHYMKQMAKGIPEARYDTLHEWGHALFGYGEGGANRFANQKSSWLNKKGIKGFAAGGQISPHSPKSPAVGGTWIKGVGGHWDPDEIYTALKQLGASDSMAGFLSAVSVGESGGNPHAIGHDPGGSTGLGLLQMTVGVGNDALINRFGGRSGMMNPWENMLAAMELYRGSGPGAWFGHQGSQGHLLLDRIKGAKGGTTKAKVPKKGKKGKKGKGSTSTTDDAAQQAVQDALDAINNQRDAINELTGQGNLEALQRYQTGTAQNPILGIGSPAFPSLSSLLPAATLDDLFTPPPVGPDVTGRTSMTFHGGDKKHPGYTGGLNTHIHIHIDGKEVQGAVKKVVKKQARGGRRPLPSAGGGH